MSEPVAATRLSFGPVAAFAGSAVAATSEPVTAMAATAVVPTSRGRRSRVVRVLVIDPSSFGCLGGAVGRKQAGTCCARAVRGSGRTSGCPEGGKPREVGRIAVWWTTSG